MPEERQLYLEGMQKSVGGPFADSVDLSSCKLSSARSMYRTGIYLPGRKWKSCSYLKSQGSRINEDQIIQTRGFLQPRKPIRSYERAS